MKRNTNVSIFFYVILFLFAFCVSGEDEFFTVNTDKGSIRGRYLKSRLGRSFLAFRGIRYAEAPVDELRFQVNKCYIGKNKEYWRISNKNNLLATRCGEAME